MTNEGVCGKWSLGAAFDTNRMEYYKMATLACLDKSGSREKAVIWKVRSHE